MSCHHGTVELKSPLLPLPMFGGVIKRGSQPNKNMFVLDLAHVVRFSDEFKYLKIIDWKNLSVPSLTHNDWQGIYDAWIQSNLPLQAICLYGHGRTGTALSIMLGLHGIKHPVSLVRKLYCVHAVETKLQAQYIKYILKD